MTTGTVKWFNSTKGFGFIQPDNGGADAFVHISAVERTGMREIVEDQKLGYDWRLHAGRGNKVWRTMYDVGHPHLVAAEDWRSLYEHGIGSTDKKEKPRWGARKIRELLVKPLAGDVRLPAKSTDVPGSYRWLDRSW